MLINYHLTHNLKVVGSNPTPATNLPYVVDCRVRLVLGVFSLTTNDTILFALKLANAVLIVNLLIIVALASYRQLVHNTTQPTEKQRDYGVASDITLADMKKKLLGSALAIGVIAVLADLMKLSSLAADFTTTLPLIVKSSVF